MKDFSVDIEACLFVLKSGGTILYPTDTVWGIGCDATNAAAVEKIIALKERPASKAMIVLLAVEKDILQYVAAPDLRVFDYLKTTTKPTTIVYNGAIGLADNLVADDGSIGIRICSEPFVRELLLRYKKPIVSTSANISGEQVPAHFNEISPVMREGVDYIVKYRQEDDTEYIPSSVVRWNSDGSVTVLRS